MKNEYLEKSKNNEIVLQACKKGYKEAIIYKETHTENEFKKEYPRCKSNLNELKQYLKTTNKYLKELKCSKKQLEIYRMEK